MTRIRIRRVLYSPDDFLVGVAGLTALEIGVYWVICSLVYSTGGPLRVDDERIARLARCRRRAQLDAAIIRLIELKKLTIDGNLISNARAEAEIERETSRLRQTQEAAAASVSARKPADPGPTSDQDDSRDAPIGSADVIMMSESCRNTVVTPSEYRPNDVRMMSEHCHNPVQTDTTQSNETNDLTQAVAHSRARAPARLSSFLTLNKIHPKDTRVWEGGERGVGGEEETNELIPPNHGEHTDDRQTDQPRRRKNGIRLPLDWGPGEHDRAFAATRGLDADAVAANFRDYWRAKSGADAVKLDWSATWRVWCRREADRGAARAAGSRGAGRDRAGFGAAASRVAAKMGDAARRPASDDGVGAAVGERSDAGRGGVAGGADRGDAAAGDTDDFGDRTVAPPGADGVGGAD